MVNVLQAIVDHRRETLANSSDVYELEQSTRSLYDALSQPYFGFIMECKMASPSKGLIRSDFNLKEIVPVYNQYADAISVLTEDRFFRGSYANLKYVSENTDKPVLCKDFILEPKQVRLARHHGADAILLMMSVLDDKSYQACKQQAEKLALDILTEVHDDKELERALKFDAKIIGINNRNLKDLSVDLSHTERLARNVPDDVIVVTESGINSHDDVLSLSPIADACLVGSSLMSQKDLDKATSELVYGDIKICGVTNQYDADALQSTPASSLGMIFVERSPRYFKDNELKSHKPRVGVFQNHSLERVLELVNKHDLETVQLHGDESVSYVKELKEALPEHCKLSKVLSIEPDKKIPTTFEYAVDEVLLDTKIGDLTGGTGQNFDWSLINEFKRHFPNLKVRVAGGIDSNNIQRLKLLGVSAIDVCGGTESEPGIKSLDKVSELFFNARAKSGRNTKR
ncbi:bifunctional indole-3-glycerol-phosphate synthase TrpC/phosphoribosylanthranilate isomerase TrpF [Kangiella sediminilitoris]|uniref:Multifunctional fusion protein n=1 Tax=Kangiella sediminilitoris TaxID=1144748 RepID=A0A1B3BBB1_9GAMM|nr:bifunctional indole-3-glycerol-phosphate synthase TrpC/phosphoribosylanthranilate isomerase TrpF [Kangiella sediminilitoris]AOE50081.1 Indole-3-glycerol-phosphate synthase [Kangiella sediminilitoris]